MQLYGSTLSPFVRKTQAVLLEKGLTAELKQVMPGGADPDFRALSPLGKIPAFRDGDFGISDSSAIIAYLEAKHPEPNLIPAAPAARAQVVWFEEFADSALSGCVGKVFRNRVVMPKFMGRPGNLEEADTCEAEEMPRYFAYLEGVLPASGYLVEDRLTLADLAVASPFVNFAHAGVTVDAGAYPKLAGFLERILGRPSFAGTIAAEKAMLGG
ncbi:MAG: glutathione S-transferase family protein [Alphaproteobacteria bacterium]|nr:glutathione S-transferase family protein [Alphaproteobacteria bacterium]